MSELLSVGAFVVSELGVDNDLNQLYSDFLVMTEPTVDAVAAACTKYKLTKKQRTII